MIYARISRFSVLHKQISPVFLYVATSPSTAVSPTHNKYLRAVSNEPDFCAISEGFLAGGDNQIPLLQPGKYLHHILVG